jgi:hypothetical protein
MRARIVERFTGFFGLGIADTATDICHFVVHAYLLGVAYRYPHSRRDLLTDSIPISPACAMIMADVQLRAGSGLTPGCFALAARFNRDSIFERLNAPSWRR